jgi:type IV secretion system protein VirD4
VVDKMPFMAGFGVKLLLVIQGLAQLDRLYGSSGRELVLANAGLQIFFASNDDQTSRYISERLGTYTETQKSRSRSTPMLGGAHGSITTSLQYHARELMKPQEVRTLPGDREIIFVESRRPVLASKIVYHRDPTFTARLFPVVAVGAIAVTRQSTFQFPDAAPPAGATVSQLLEAATRPLTASEINEVRGLDGAALPSAGNS